MTRIKEDVIFAPLDRTLSDMSCQSPDQEKCQFEVSASKIEVIRKANRKNLLVPNLTFFYWPAVCDVKS